MFPIIKNKKFQDIATGKIVSVLDQFEDVAILEGRQRINVNRLLDKSLYEEFIDPMTFFSQSATLSSLAEKIRSIPNEALAMAEDDAADQSLVMPYDPEEEKRQLLEKYSVPQPQPAHNDALLALIEDRPPAAAEPADVVRVDARRDLPVEATAEAPRSPRQQDDPIAQMFRGAKRKNRMTITLSIEKAIPRPDFIEMMEDSYERSIIDFLSQEFADEIASDTQALREEISRQIRAVVYGEGAAAADTPAPPAQSPSTPNMDRQNNEGEKPEASPARQPSEKPQAKKPARKKASSKDDTPVTD